MSQGRFKFTRQTLEGGEKSTYQHSSNIQCQFRPQIVSPQIVSPQIVSPQIVSPQTR